MLKFIFCVISIRFSFFAAIDGAAAPKGLFDAATNGAAAPEGLFDAATDGAAIDGNRAPVASTECGTAPEGLFGCSRAGGGGCGAPCA